jgi:hypothetical protein
MDGIAVNVPQVKSAYASSSSKVVMVEGAGEFSLKPGIPEARPGTQHPKLEYPFLNINTRFPINF